MYSWCVQVCDCVAKWCVHDYENVRVCVVMKKEINSPDISVYLRL